MKKHIKELTTSDVMVVLIKQEQTPDRIQDLRLHFQHSHQPIQKITHAEQIILLPDFATQTLSEIEILAYHLDKQRTSEAQLLNYKSLLEGIDQQMKKVIEKSTQDCLHSNQIIHELKLKLDQTCSLVTLQRQPVSRLLQHFQNKYLAIARKMTIIANMQKALDVMKFWKEIKVSSVITIKPEKIHNYNDLGSILQTFQQIKKAISAKKQQFSHFGNLVSLVNERKKALIRTIYLNALNRIIKYSNDSDLASKLKQFEYITKNGLLEDIKDSRLPLISENLNKEEYFLKMIDQNIEEMYRVCLLKKHTTVAQSLKEDNFVEFYECLTLEYSQYFSNWHKITTYHMQQNHSQKEQFIKNRTLVFNKMMEKIEYALKFSGKLQSLGLFRLKKLFKCLTDFMQFGEQWMGKCKTNLRTLIKQKMESEVTHFSKTKNGEIRRLMLEEFSRNSFFDFEKQKKVVLDEIWGFFNQAKRFREISEDSESKHKVIEQQTLQQEVSKYYQRLRCKLSMNFFRIITEYRLRQEQTTQCSQLPLLNQHFQFAISVLYRTFVPNYMRSQLENQTFNETFRSQKINSVNNAIFRNSIDEEAIMAVNKLRHNFCDRNNFGYLYDFIKEVGSRNEALNLTPSTTQLFNEPDKYQQQLCDVSLIFLEVSNQFYVLLEYIEYIISQSAFSPRQEKVQQKFVTLKQVLVALVLQYFTSFYEKSLKKYYSQVLPVFTSIKFEVKKKNDIITGLRDYRNKIAQIYNRFAIYKTNRNNCFQSLLYHKQNEYFYKFVIDMFSRIDKINDDARQILKQEPVQLHKVTGVDKNSCTQDSWPLLIEYFLEVSKERNGKALQEAVQRTVLMFPVQWWKSNLSWFYNDCSSKQKKEFFLKVVQIYLNRLISLPRI